MVEPLWWQAHRGWNGSPYAKTGRCDHQCRELMITALLLIRPVAVLLA